MNNLQNISGWIILLILIAQPLYAHRHNGKDRLLLGFDPATIGRGGTGSTYPGMGTFFVNPSSIGDIDRYGINTSYGFLDKNAHHSGLITAIPTFYATFGLGIQSVFLPSGSEDLSQANLFSFGAAKKLSQSVMAGTAIDFLHGENRSENYNYAGLRLGMIYISRYSKNIAGISGIYSPKIGFSFRAGTPLKDTNRSVNFNEATIGYSFNIIEQESISVGLYNDLSLVSNLVNYRIHCGLETMLYRRYIVRAGALVPAVYNYSNYTLGAGYHFNSRYFDGHIDYSLSYHAKTDLAHYFGVAINYGRPDDQPPRIEITPSGLFMSPNYDGTKDYILFRTSVKDFGRIKGWRLRIRDRNNVIVKEYNLPRREIDEKITFSNIFRKILSKKESMIVPEFLLWDGANASGSIVPDGEYQYSFLAWDERDNISPIQSGKLFIDNTSPQVDLFVDEMLFSPNNDNRKDIFIIQQEGKSSSDDMWKACFIGHDGTVIRSYTWKGQIANKISWDGKDDSGREAPEGVYTYIIESTDQAGNHEQKSVKGISLTRKYEIADITASHDFFSISKHGHVNFFPTLSGTKGLQSWEITFYNDRNNPVREIKGTDTFEPIIKWDGKDSQGNTLPDGQYQYHFKAVFDSGNRPQSFNKTLILDNSPPTLSLNLESLPFSPDNDGNNEILTIKPDVREKYGISKWEILIISPDGQPFKYFRGNKAPASEIKWNGLNENNELVESAVDYKIDFSCIDRAGNSAALKGIRLPVDVLVLVTEQGLKIRISNIEFSFGSSKLGPKTIPVLNRVATILKKYSSYAIHIVGHTDDLGEEDYNFKLSEERARSVMEYLIEKGIDKERLSYEGRGESDPFLPNTRVENRRRNRRVEFLLKK